MKKLFLLLIYALNLISCTSEKTKIAFLLPNLKADRYIKEKLYFTQKINEAGYEVEFFNANYSQEDQFSQVDSCFAKGIKVLVLDAVNVNLAAQIVRNAHDRGVDVIAYDRLIKNAELDFYVSFKYEAIGEELAKYAINQNTPGNFVYVGGDKTDNNAIFIDNGIFKVLNPYIKDNKVRLLYKIYIDEWNADMAYKEFNFFLKLSGQIPDAIICLSDKMAGGILKALEEHNLAGKVILTGMDAEKASCRNIISGKQSMTVYKPVKQLAVRAAEIAIKFAENKRIDEVTDMVWNGKKEIPLLFL